MINLISAQVEDYISYKQALGYKIKIESEELRRFAAYTVFVGHDGSLTADIAFQWVTLKPNYTLWYMSRRLETVRTFAKYISIFDPNAQVPPKGLLEKCHGRVNPYIFTEKEISIIMDKSAHLHSPDGLRCLTIPVAIGLMWATGIRPSEACNLLDSDVDVDLGLIHIRETKFSKNRCLPIHDSVIAKLRDYRNKRDDLRTNYTDSHFFIMTSGKPLILRNFEYSLQLTRNSLLPEHGHWNRRPPRLYDIRHSFACRTLYRWYKEGVNVNNRLAYLSTYMGHVKIADTYWYLTGTPELLQYASNAFEEFFNGQGGALDEPQ